MDTAALCRLNRLGATVDILRSRAREAADDGVLGALGDLVYGGKVAVRCNRKAGLDDVNAHIVEQLGDRELLFVRHGCARALLAVAQGGVKDDDAVLFGLLLRGHWISSFSSNAPLGALYGVALPSPPSAQAQMPSRPSGADKEKERAQNEGGHGFGHLGRPSGRANTVARGHYLQVPRIRPVASRKMLKPALTVADTRLLAESDACPQEWPPGFPLL